MKLYFTIIIISIILMFLFIYERKKMSVMEICICASLSSIAGVLRVFFAFIPSLQPMTFIIMITGFVFGPFWGFATGVLSTLVSNCFLGHGPWSIWQMIAWGLIGSSFGFASKYVSKPSKGFFMFFGFIWGFGFGLIMNLWHFLYFVFPQNLTTLMTVMAGSFYFDLIHAVGNLVFAYVASIDLINILTRFKERLTNYSYGE